MLLFLPTLLLSGCVQTQFTKSITVRRDADGRILERVESETMTQPMSTFQMRIDLMTNTTVWDKRPPTPAGPSQR